MDKDTNINQERQPEPEPTYIIGVSTNGLTNNAFISGEYDDLMTARVQFFQMCILLSYGCLHKIELKKVSEASATIILSIDLTNEKVPC